MSSSNRCCRNRNIRPDINDDPHFLDFLLPTFFSVSFRDQKHGAACGLEGWVIQTDDGGKTWRFAHQAEKPGAPPDTLVPGAPHIPARDPLFSIDLFGGDQGITTGLTGTVLRLQPNGAWAHDPSRCPRYRSRSARCGSSTRSTDGSSATARSCTPRTAARPGASARDERERANNGNSENAMTWYRFGEWILRWRFMVLAVVGALTAFFGYFAAQTQLVTSFGDLLPQNHPFIQIAHKYDQYFGSVNNVTIMIEAQRGDDLQPRDHQEDRPHDAEHGSRLRDPARIGALDRDLQLFPPAGRRRDSQHTGAAQRRHSQDSVRP